MKKIVWLATLLGLGLVVRRDAGAGGPRGLIAARAGFVTQAAPSTYQRSGTAPAPAEGFDRVRYQSPAGPLAAYVSRDPGDGKRRPAVLWAHGGFGGIGAGDLEQVEPLVDAGLVVMCPSWRGENDNRGRYEMFYGELDDALAALDHLSHLPWVDPSRLFVAGHSTGGTIALLVAESSERPRAVFSLGGAPDMERIVAGGGYDDATPPSPRDRPREAELRSPIRFVSSISSPTFHYEGARSPAYVTDARKMAEAASGGGIPFLARAIEGGDHFTIVTPLLAHLARRMADDPGPPFTFMVPPAEAQGAFDASRPARHLRHAPTGLEMALRAPGAEVCQIIPAGPPEDPACVGIDVEKVRASMSMKVPPLGVATLRF